MQRIDENTYIDDTLVTCAEYQLFIDEMREQGKYYQPDHWKSYQFPTGQAREPILGVRSSDAIAFCEWLTQRDNRQWDFRLPKASEAQTYKLTNPSLNPIGYWTINQDLVLEFSWVGIVPAKPKNYDRKLASALNNNAVDAMMDIFRSSKFYDTLTIDLSAASSIQVISSLVDIDPFSAFDSRNKDDRDQAILLSQSISRLINSQSISLLTTYLAIDRKREVDIRQASNLAQEFSFDLISVLSSIEEDRISYMINDQLITSIKLINDLLNLEDRIAQKHLPFESIRITKQKNVGAAYL